MRYLGQAMGVVLAIIASPAVSFGQSSQTLSLTNYQIVSESPGVYRNNVVYTADLVNTGGPLGSVTATLTSANLISFTLAPGQDTLTFGPVPANSHVSTTSTVLLLVNPGIPFDLSNLQWSFQTTPLPPVANAGPNQSVTLGSTVMLDGSGSTNPSGVGTVTYSWSFVSRPAASTASLQNPTSVRPSFVLDAPGNYVVELTVSNSGGSSSANVTIGTTYMPPVANAGPNQTTTVGSTVTLNGSGSTDVNLQPLTYTWTLVSAPTGSMATLNGDSTVMPTFVVDKFGSYMAQLVVNDTQSSSTAATVTITTLDTPPVANGGPNQLVSVGDMAQLNGAGSTDVNGNPLTYSWSLLSLPAGSTATLSSATAVNPTFTVDVAGTYVAQLIVNDGTYSSKPVTVLLTTDTVLAPTANPGTNQTVDHKTNVQLNGSGTDAQGLPLTFQWALLSKPMGSAATLSNTGISGPTFYADLPGNYVAQLIVSNPYLSSPPATVTITTYNTPPVANAGPNQNVLVGANVTLDGSGSSDADHDPITYSWSLLSVPTGSGATLSAATTVSPMFAADVPGTYVAQLIVNDGFANSTPATVTITAVQIVKITLTPNPLNMSTAAPGTLTITLAGPAGANGQVINLTSFGPQVASVPATVTVPAGATAANVAVTPGTTGSTSVYATAPGFQAASATVNVISAGISITTAAAFIGPTRTTNGQIFLSAPAPPGGAVVSLAATPSGFVDVEPPSVTIPAGATSGVFTATGVSYGTATITASSPGFTSGMTGINVVLVGYIILPPSLTVSLGQTAVFPLKLATPAPVGGVTLNLASDNAANVSITPTSVFIPAGATASAVLPVVTGLNFGSANISAAAPGFAVGNPTPVQVGATLSFSPQNLTMSPGVGTLSLVLSGPAPAAGLTVTLNSSNTSVAIVPPIVTFLPFTSMANVPVFGFRAGTTLIDAKGPGLADVTAGVTVH